MALRKKTPAVPRLFAIGDIHGCVDELAVMLKAIAPIPGDTVVFVGDYIDRGPAAREVVDLLLEFQTGPAKAVFLKGNHEDMLLSFMGLPGRYGDAFMFNGGAPTLESYGIGEADLSATRELIPPIHLKFFSALQHSYLRPPFLFVHAGIKPGLPLEEQSDEDLLWIRQEFIFQPHQLETTVVFGHTPMRTVMVDTPYKLGIDTGLVYGGKLTCLELTEGVVYQVGRGSRQAKKSRLETD
jgi:serine/threonine protein phosphatase 1